MQKAVGHGVELGSRPVLWKKRLEMRTVAERELPYRLPYSSACARIMP